MPTLDWIGKAAVVNHHNEVPYRLIRCDGDNSAGAVGEGNLLVEGDNLHALKALLPYYGGKVKCIYIDPPYNTGNEGWVYNDNVNSPEIRKWLGQVVGREAEDLSRHDKWLCMMYPRLVLLRQFLREDGAIFISLDDNEAATCRLLVEEIFGRGNFVATIAWQRRISPDARLGLSQAHDHILVFAKNVEHLNFNKIPVSAEQTKAFKNPDNDPRGAWVSTDFTAQGWRPNQMYKITAPGGSVYEPATGRCWANIESEFERLKSENRMWFGRDGKGRPRVKTYLSESEGISSWTWWTHGETGHNQEAKKEINAIMGFESPFDTPKPVRLIKRVLQLVTNPSDVVLDSFAGSATTGHAVLQLNKEDGGNRRLILVEMEERISREITAGRLKRVINGYGDTPGLGGGFRYCTLGEPLFDEHGQIRDGVKFGDLAHHVFFTETGEPLPKPNTKTSPLLGAHNGRAVYLLFNGILGDKSVNGGNVLTSRTLALLPPHDGERVVYGTACRLSPARLKRERITFRQIPYEIKTT